MKNSVSHRALPDLIKFCHYLDSERRRNLVKPGANPRMGPDSSRMKISMENSVQL
jgi:hypothetical protein